MLRSSTAIPCALSARATSTSASTPPVDGALTDRVVDVDSGFDTDDARHDAPYVVEAGPIDGDDVDVVAADLALERPGVAAGDDAAVVDHDDVVGEALGLLEVLRGQQQRDAPPDERVEHVPQLGPRPRVETGGRLVEEQHLGIGHQRGGEVEAPSHAAGVTRHLTVGGIGEREVLEQLDGTRRRDLARQLVQLAEHDEVLTAGQQVVDGGVLGGEADAPAHLGALGGDVEAGDGRRAHGGVGERGEDAHGRGLAGAVRPEHGGDGAGAHLEVDALEGEVVAVALHQPAGDHGVLGGVERARAGSQLTLVRREVEASGIGRRCGRLLGHVGVSSDR